MGVLTPGPVGIRLPGMNTGKTIRVADRTCKTCGRTAQVTECRSSRFTAQWVSREIVQVDRMIHCDGHAGWEREINGQVTESLS